MLEKRQKHWVHTVFNSYITAVLLFCLVVVLGRSVYERFVIERDMADRRAQVEAELHELTKRHTELQAQVEYLSHDRGIEAEMRRQFDVAKEGEQVVIILEDEPEGSVAGAATSTPDDAPWYRFWR